MLNSILTLSVSGLTIKEFLYCSLFSIIFGCMMACVHMYKNQYSQNFIFTIILLPLIVQTVIMLSMEISERVWPLREPSVWCAFAQLREIPGRLPQYFWRWLSDWQTAWDMLVLEAFWWSS